MDVTRSFLDDIKTKQLKWYEKCSENGRGKAPKTDYEMEPSRKKETGRPKLTWMEGIRGLMGEKGLVEEDWNDIDDWRKKIL
jgi:hypothetical protein